MAARNRAQNPAQIFSNYLQTTLLINDNDVRQALIDQGLTSFTDMLGLTEEDIEEICANVRKPGGMIANPNAAVAGQPAMIANPGQQIGHIHEKRLKQLRYYMHHLQRIQRLPIVRANATLPVLQSVYQLKDVDESEDDLALPDKFNRIDTARVVLENLDDYLLRKKSETGVPLAYVVRQIVALPAVAEDVGFGLPSFIEEMVRRAPHGTPQYQTDNVLVWNVIRHVAHGGPAWNWVSRFARTSDGREAYLAFKAHYLGQSYQERIRAIADSKIENAFFDGKNRNFTFENYCGLLNNAFTDIESTGEIVSVTRKIRCFLNGLHDPRLETAKSQVLATPTLRDSFEDTVNFVSQYLDTRKSLTSTAGRNRNVSSSTTSSSGRTNNSSGRGSNNSRGGGGRGGRTGRTYGRGRSHGGRSNNSGRQPNTYIPYEQWRNMTDEQRAAMRNAREVIRSGGSNVSSVTQTSPPTHISTNTGASDSPTSVITPISSQSQSIGAIMSRRGQMNNNNQSN